MYGPPLPPTRLGSVVAAHPANKHTGAQRQAVLGLQYLLWTKRSAERRVYEIEPFASRSFIRFYSSSTAWSCTAATSHESA